MPENEGSRPQKRTKMPILCSGMVAANLAAPTGAQHCPPRALRGAFGSSTPGNRLPQPTTQPVAVHAAGNSTVHTPVELPQKATAVCCRRHTCRHATCRQDLPAGILPCIPPTNLPPCATARELPPVRLPAGAYYLALGPAPSGRVIRM